MALAWFDSIPLSREVQAEPDSSMVLVEVRLGVEGVPDSPEAGKVHVDHATVEAPSFGCTVVWQEQYELLVGMGHPQPRRRCIPPPGRRVVWKFGGRHCWCGGDIGTHRVTGMFDSGGVGLVTLFFLLSGVVPADGP